MKKVVIVGTHFLAIVVGAMAWHFISNEHSHIRDQLIVAKNEGREISGLILRNAEGKADGRWMISAVTADSVLLEGARGQLILRLDVIAGFKPLPTHEETNERLEKSIKEIEGKPQTGFPEGSITGGTR